MKKRIILQAISELGDGGVETMLMNIYKNIDKNKFQFVFMVQNDSRKYADEISRYGGYIVQIKPLKEVGILEYIKSVENVCINEHVDVIHCHNLNQNLILLYAAKKAGVKIRISHSHLTTCFSKYAKILMPIIRMGINRLATVKLACGCEAGKFLYGTKDYILINNAIDLEKYISCEKDTETIKRELGINNKKIILHVGRLSEQKNHIYLVKIIQELVKTNNDIILLCCGKGPKYQEIYDIITKYGLHSYIKLLGSRNDIDALMKISDLMLLPSLYEGFPVSLVESQASGLKAIVSDSVDKKSDLGLGLIDFLPIKENDIYQWSKLIIQYLNSGYIVPDNRYNILTEKGYNSKINSKLLEDIYSEN